VGAHLQAGQLELGATEDPAQPVPAARLFRATREHGGAVVTRELTDAERVELEVRGLRRSRPGPLPRSTANQDILDCWVGLLGPYFDESSAVNITGTYRDDYGESNGLMAVRNVLRDFARAVRHERPDEGLARAIGVERHNTGRDVLHFHAMVGGDWTSEQIESLKRYWDFSRGWSVVKPVSDLGGCVAYCAKHLLKRGAEDNFAFEVPGRVYGSRYQRRHPAVSAGR
jgi:hypothetical protein